MRRITITTLILVIISGVSANAQEFKNEISFSMGVATFPDMAEVASEAALVIGLFGLVTQELEDASPAYVINYRHFTNEHLSIGLTFNYQRHKVAHYSLRDYTFTSEVRFYTFMARADYTYFRSDLWQLYSGCGLGVCIIRETAAEIDTEQDFWFAFHVNAFGVRVGKRVAGFIELGFGYNGIAAAGLTAAF
jgi:hypothetical protein